MDFTGTLLYILLGIASFALVAFFAWATWSGGREPDRDDDDGLPPEQPGTPPPTRPSQTVPMTREEAEPIAGRA